jgi:hypothetical protein
MTCVHLTPTRFLVRPQRLTRVSPLPAGRAIAQASHCLVYVRRGPHDRVNEPSETNPRTGKLTYLSTLAMLKALANPLKVGT